MLYFFSSCLLELENIVPFRIWKAQEEKKTLGSLLKLKKVHLIDFIVKQSHTSGENKILQERIKYEDIIEDFISSNTWRKMIFIPS